MIYIQRKVLLLCCGLIFLSLAATAQDKNNKTQNVFVITLDGFRWEELFGGAVDSLMHDPVYVKDTVELRKLFGATTTREKREKLMPWFWSNISKNGQLYGNRWLGNKVNVSNPHWFSYPGYNEILTGFADPRVNSNDKIDNPNVTILEWLNRNPKYKGQVAAFGSWDVFPYIINEKRSGIPVNAGFRTAKDKELSNREAFLNELQPQVPSPWSSVRFDAFTHYYALEYMKRKHPKVVYIAYGETDDFAHDGQYDSYLKSAHQTDALIKALWEYAQSDSFYAGKTTFLITTDHGRGSKTKDAWKNHGAKHVGSDAIWFAVMGPDTPASGEMKQSGQYWQNQLAKTIANFLELNYTNTKTVGNPVTEVFK